MYNSQPARLLLKRTLVLGLRTTERNRQPAKDIENDLRPVRFIWKTRRKTKRGKKPKRNIHRRFPVVFLSVHLVRHQFLLDPFIVLFILFAFRCVSSEPELNINCIYGDISQKHKSYFKRFSPPSCTLHLQRPLLDSLQPCYRMQNGGKKCAFSYRFFSSTSRFPFFYPIMWLCEMSKDEYCKATATEWWRKRRTMGCWRYTRRYLHHLFLLVGGFFSCFVYSSFF